MAATAATRSALERENGTNHAVETVVSAQHPDPATRSEVDIVARTLCAVSIHTTLTEALLSFYASLEPAEARERSTQVLERMRKILPHDLAENLPEMCRYTRPWAEGVKPSAEEGKRSLVHRFALPAVYLIGAMLLALSFVGSITTIHYLLGR